MLRWMQALATAYDDNPAIVAVIYYLQYRLGESNKTLQQTSNSAHVKFKNSEYWQHRDQEFQFTALLDANIPPLALCCHKYFD